MGKKYCYSISAYPALDHSLEQIELSLKVAAALGASNVFTSYHLPEANYQADEFVVKFNKFCELVEKYGLKLIIDVSGKSFKNLVVPKCICALRLDYGFTNEEIVNLSKSDDFAIELNASVLTIDKIEELINLGLNVSNTRLSYNFYPKLYTGMDIFEVASKNKILNSYGFHIMAYLPGVTFKREPLCEGLPSVESHRYMKPMYAATELLLTGVDEIGFGDPFVKLEELEEVKQAVEDFKNNIINVPLNVYSDVSSVEHEILDGLHSLRLDEAPYMHRSSKGRGKAVLPRPTRDVSILDVTIDNELYKRYVGELGIARRPMLYNERVNIVGYIDQVYINLVDLLKPGYKFRFVKTVVNN